ncbi:MAG TPA: hypothetical protein VK473_10395 [Terriglobales bacterium]|nr:hypothetical protein [Terriglobales bacterium]
MTVPEDAVMVVLPVATPCARPLVVTVATAVFDEVHVTEDVTSLVVPSLKVPTAENCCVGWLDKLMDGFWGEIEIEFSGELTTLTVVEPVIPPEVAEIVADPVATAVASPVAEIVTTCRFDEVHVRSLSVLVVPLSKTPEAENCCVPPFKSDGLGGDTVMEVN